MEKINMFGKIKIKIYIKKQKTGMTKYILVTCQKVILSIEATHKFEERINNLIKIDIHKNRQLMHTRKNSMSKLNTLHCQVK